jgi:hypothetical protein
VDIPLAAQSAIQQRAVSRNMEHVVKGAFTSADAGFHCIWCSFHVESKKERPPTLLLTPDELNPCSTRVLRI